MTNLNSLSFSNKGKRDTNQDFLIEKEGLYILADGMGGLSDGKKAAKLACEALAEELMKVDLNIENINIDVRRKDIDVRRKDIDVRRKDIEKRVFDSVKLVSCSVEKQIPNSGTTLCFLIIKGTSFLSVGIGDSRIYMFENGTSQLTIDQNLSTMFGYKYGKNMLTSYIGKKHLKRPSFSHGTITNNTKFLLCTDGLYNCVDIPSFENLILSSNIRESLLTILNTAVVSNPDDNFSCIIASK